jgi:hypothetical protein
MAPMLAVRYVALAALVIWLGGTTTLNLLTTPTRDVMRSFDVVSVACGALIMIALLVMKFVGPPPPAFLPRLAIVAVMLGMVLYGVESRQPSRMPALVEAALGFILLFWYTRE